MQPQTSIFEPVRQPPRRRRKRHDAPAASPPSPPPPPPPATVTVTAVTVVADDPRAADFSFSQPVTCDGAECPAISLDMGGIVDYPRSSQQLSPTSVRFFWIDDFIDAGDAWSIDEVPAVGLDFHGATMPVPQAGVVT